MSVENPTRIVRVGKNGKVEETFVVVENAKLVGKPLPRPNKSGG